jgi:hypothetical protein
MERSLAADVLHQTLKIVFLQPSQGVCASTSSSE